MLVAKEKRSTFASLQLRGFRLFVTGQFVAYTGSWVQRIAQDWLVLSLTGSVTAVGITSGLQSFPIMVFGPVGGLLADRFPKRLVLMATQVASGTIALILAVLSFTHLVQVWHIYLAALAVGVAFAVESPARNSYINELVGPRLLRNAISINASTIQLGGLLGPAMSGVLVSAVGFGWGFALNAASYTAPIAALYLLRNCEPDAPRRSTGEWTRLRDGLTYVRARPAILYPTLLAGVFGMFTINLQTTLAAYTKSIFHSGAGGYGLLNSVLAAGALAGALVSARIGRTRLRTLLGSAAGVATLFMLAAPAPNRATYCVVLVGLGAGLMLFYTSASTALQLAATDSVRGRVMGIFAVVYFGGGALGGPIVGWLDDQFGPRIGMLLGGLIPAAATVLVGLKLATSGRDGSRAVARAGQLPDRSPV